MFLIFKTLLFSRPKKLRKDLAAAVDSIALTSTQVFASPIASHQFFAHTFSRFVTKQRQTLRTFSHVLVLPSSKSRYDGYVKGQVVTKMCKKPPSGTSTAEIRRKIRIICFYRKTCPHRNLRNRSTSWKTENFSKHPSHGRPRVDFKENSIGSVPNLRIKQAVSPYTHHHHETAKIAFKDTKSPPSYHRHPKLCTQQYLLTSYLLYTHPEKERNWQRT